MPNTAPVFRTQTGWATPGTTGSDPLWRAVQALADGSFLAAGGATGAPELQHLLRDGSVDGAWHASGLDALKQAGFGALLHLQTLPSGKIIVAAVVAPGAGASSYDMGVARLNADGSLDPSFGSGGWTVIDAGKQESLFDLRLSGDGKIWLAGTTGGMPSPDNAAFLTRLDASGHPDQGFGQQGTVVFAGDGDTTPWGVLPLADGRVMLAGEVDVAGATVGHVFLQRFTASGQADPTFKGQQAGDVGMYIMDTLLQPDGKTLVLGFVDIGDSYTQVLARYQADGSLDPSFAGDGVMTLSLAPLELPYWLSLQPDGKIVVVGTGGESGGDAASNAAVYVGRVNSNGSIDASFGNGGLSMIHVGMSISPARPALQANGDIVIAGTSNTFLGKLGESFLLRLNSAGQFDTTLAAHDTLGNVAVHDVTKYYTATVLDPNVQISDAELNQLGYGGATLHIARHDGPNGVDVFANVDAWGQHDLVGTGEINGRQVATVLKNEAGELLLRFDAGTTAADVIQFMRSIAYVHTGAAASGAVTLDWTFSDGNSGAQGSGGALSVTGSSTVLLNSPPQLYDQTLVCSTDGFTLQASDFDFADADGDTAPSFIRLYQPSAGYFTENDRPMRSGAKIPFSEIEAGHVKFVPAGAASGATISIHAAAYDQLEIRSDTASLTLHLGSDHVQGTSASEALYGTERADVFVSGGGSDTIESGGGNDLITCSGGSVKVFAGAGDDRVIDNAVSGNVFGGHGLDTVQYAFERNACEFARSNDSSFYVRHNGALEFLTDVERVQFTDTMYALDIDGNAGQAYRLYQAAFDRTPDAHGLGYWISRLDAGASLQEVAAAFVQSPEFLRLAGEHPTSAELATEFYRNVLHRTPDADGLAYWSDLLDRQVLSAADVLIGFSESGENQAALIGVVGDGFRYELFQG